MNTQKTKKVKKSVSEIIVYIIAGIFLLAIASSYIALFAWGLLNSFKSILNYAIDMVGFPKEFVFSNFVDVLKNLPMKKVTSAGEVTYGIPVMLLNSLIFSFGRAIASVIGPALVAYPVAKYNFKGKHLIFTIALVDMLVPFGANLGVSLEFHKWLKTYDNMVAQIALGFPAFGFDFLLLHACFKGISWSYAEAATIDGASDFKIMTEVMFPMAFPTFVTIFMLNFAGLWNNYSAPLVWIPSYPTLMYGMYVFEQKSRTLFMGTPQVLAGLFLTAIPTMFLYVFTQRFLKSGFMVGGLKG